MKDTIYREDAVKCVGWGDSVTEVINRIKSLPSAETPTTDEKHQLSSEAPTETPTDTISRADAIKAVAHEYGGKRIRSVGETVADILQALKTLPSAEAEQTVIRSKTLMPTKDFKEWAKRIREENPNAVIIPCDAEVASAEAKRVLQGYCKGADCKWWNPQVEGCNRCVFVKDEYTHPSAEATCATCADRAMCIMSGDGNWKACKDYREEKPYYDEDDYWEDRQTEAVNRKDIIGYIDRVKNSGLGRKKALEYIRKYVERTESADAVPQSEQYKKGFEDCKRAYEVELARSGEAVQGEWIEMGKNKDGTHNIKCNQCGEGYQTRGHAQSLNTRKKYKFCPSCGAKMKGGEE